MELSEKLFDSTNNQAALDKQLNASQSTKQSAVKKVSSEEIPLQQGAFMEIY